MKQINNMNETWFSNQLAWLLDIHGSHGLGNQFLVKFLKDTDIQNYDTLEVVREFYIKLKNGTRKVDVVMIDFENSKMVLIENKLDGKNSKNQLSDNLEVQNMFYNMDVKYIFLSYDEKIDYKKEETQERVDIVKAHYIEKIWIEDILNILEDMVYDNYLIYRLVQNIKKNKIQKNEQVFGINEIRIFFINVLNKLELLNNKNTKISWKINQRGSISRKLNSNGGERIAINIKDNLLIISFKNHNYRMPLSLSVKQLHLSIINIAIKAFLELKSNESINVNNFDVTSIYDNLK